ncbi:MAG: ATP-binding cassette domain-containing protein [Spirochaetia bacterium]|jgi:ABC-2 type transport system ATP-binding protein|nr:ATP-binding cassette domain-containing protein [Spirochaetia bacterium]
MISINNLTKYFGETAAVSDICLEIPRGQIIGILGPNGAGKTTTLRMLTGYITPTSGSVVVNGIDASTNFIEVKRHIGYLPESSPIYTDMLVYDYLKFIANIRDIPNSDIFKKFLELSDLCGIREVMHKSVSTLSKGYKQRVGLALALMGDPDILILDEPTSGLDPNQIAEIRSIIKEIGKKKTIIFSTHILSEAEATCDRVVIMNKGQLVADGTAEILKADKSGKKTTLITLEYTDPITVKTIFAKLKGISKIEMAETTDTLKIKLSTSDDMRVDIYNLIKKQDWILLEMIQESESLEHIFKELTKEA